MSIANEENVVNIIDYFEKNPQNSIRQILAALRIFKSTSQSVKKSYVKCANANK